MTDLLVGIGLVLVLEGLAYALAPEFMKNMMEQMQTVPAQSLRVAGAACLAIGVFIVWMVRG